MGKRDPRVDAYIARSAPFARPVLKHIRRIVHAGCPDVEETLKWGMPAFMYDGILCGMAAFKQHATFGFWKRAAMVKKGLPAAAEKAMGQFGRITSVADLPSERTLLHMVKEAVALQAVKEPPKPRPRVVRTLTVPAYFMTAVRRNKRALDAFKGFSYSHKKEYLEWVGEAKTDATRTRRLETAIEWMAQGKGRNWKYERK